MNKTNQILNKISDNIPNNLKKNVTKIETDTSGEELANHVLNSNFISKDKKRKIYELKEAGKFRKTEEVINEENVAKIDTYNTKEINKKIASGELPDPMKDKFYRERIKRQASGNINKTNPATREEIMRAREMLKRK